MILLIDNYDSFTYNLYQYLLELGAECHVMRNDAITVADIEQESPTHIVISPGPGYPRDAGISIEVVRRLGRHIPLLGVCLGHQAIAEAFGGHIVHADHIMHGKTSKIHHNGDDLYRHIEDPFVAVRYHSLVVEQASLPSCLSVTAQTEDGTIMGMRHATLPIVGVQFHPESIGTVRGKMILDNFLHMRAPS